MGAGKTTVGRLVAQALGVPFVDLDELVVQETGRSIPEWFAVAGEAGFREQEVRALERLVDRGKPGIWALGGGAVLQPGVRAALRRAGAQVVWLRADFEEIRRRIGPEGRPLWAAGTEAVRRLWAARQAAYREAAQFAVDADGPPDVVAATVIRWIRERGYVAEDL
ncbi:MAG: shikimate kinase [Actinomycetia bacterium]|nr:shikimate kinase [Actinomycetes bacterium]